MQAKFRAPGIECGGCAASIERALGRQPGVEVVAVNVPTKTVRVQFDESSTSREAIAEALTEAGFPPEQDE